MANGEVGWPAWRSARLRPFSHSRVQLGVWQKGVEHLPNSRTLEMIGVLLGYCSRRARAVRSASGDCATPAGHPARARGGPRTHRALAARHIGQPQPSARRSRAGGRICTRSGACAPSSTPSTSMWPSPTNRSRTLMGLYYTGILQFSVACSAPFLGGIPRVQPRALVLLTPPSNGKSRISSLGYSVERCRISAVTWERTRRGPRSSS